MRGKPSSMRRGGRLAAIVVPLAIPLLTGSSALGAKPATGHTTARSSYDKTRGANDSRRRHAGAFRHAPRGIVPVRAGAGARPVRRRSAGGALAHAAAVSAFPPGYQSAIDGYLTNVAAADGLFTNVYAVETQYWDNTGNVMYGSSFGASVIDTDPVPSAVGCSDPAFPDGPCVTDPQIANEIHHVATSQNWPRGLGPVFYLVTPPGFASCFDNMPSDGCYAYNGGYCAYHNDFTVNGVETIYANVPFGDIAGCRTGTLASQPDHPNGNSADDTVNLISHEQNEAITDPSGFFPGWYHDPTSQSDPKAFLEIGDLCYTTYGSQLGGSSGNTAYNQSINNFHYELQTEWSNDAGACDATETPPLAQSPQVSTNGVSYHTNGVVLHTNTSYVIYWQPGPPPAATPTISPGPYYPGHPVSFSATSNYAGATYSWSFGDGNAAGGAAPIHSYAAPGTYTVSVTPTFDHATGPPATQVVTVADAPPTAAFDPSVATAKTGQAISFNAAASIDPDGSPVTLSWNFGDGQTATGGPTISHSYATAGPKTVTLTVTDSVGLGASTTRAVTITPAHLFGGLTFVPGQTRRSVLAHGLRIKVGCNDACLIGSNVRVRALVQRSRHRKKLTLIQLASASSRLAAAGQAQLTLPLNRAARRLLGRLRSPLVTVSLSVTPPDLTTPLIAGTTETSTAKLRLSG